MIEPRHKRMHGEDARSIELSMHVKLRNVTCRLWHAHDGAGICGGTLLVIEAVLAMFGERLLSDRAEPLSICYDEV